MHAKKIVILSVLLVLILTLAAVAFAASGQGSVGKDEIINGDLYISSPAVTNKGIIKGDLGSIEQKLDSPGKIEGDLLCISEETNVSGSILGNMRCISANTRLDGEVSKNVTALSSSFYMGNKSKISGSAILFSNDIKIYGNIVGNTKLYAQSIVLQGEFFGDIDATLDGSKDETEIRILPGTKIHGKLTYKGPKKAEIGTDVQISNTQWIDTNSGAYGESYIVKHIKEFIGVIFTACVFFLIAMMFYRIFPNVFMRQGEIIRKEKARVLCMGLMAMASILVSVFIFGILLMVTLIAVSPGVAIVFGFAAFVFYLLIFFFSTMPVSVWVGEVLSGGHKMSPPKSFALGLFVVSSFTFILEVFSSLPGYTGQIFSMLRLSFGMIVLLLGSGTIIYIIRDICLALRTKSL